MLSYVVSVIVSSEPNFFPVCPYTLHPPSLLSGFIKILDIIFHL